MGKPVHRSNGQGGFTLIELMIAMAILGMGMIAAVSMHFGTARNNTNSDIITQATMLARTQLETLKSLNITNLVSGGPFPDTDINSIPLINSNGQPGMRDSIFRRYWTIQNLGTDARRITVTVEFQRVRLFGGQRRVVISSNTKGNGV
jgi:prepilin-type N-terminal cleavage/methylation domain-containing protein